MAADLSAKLYHSVDENNCAELSRIIELGADINHYFDDLSHINSKAILHFACAKGRTECVKILLENGALVNITDKWRMTPIIYCISSRNNDIIKMLVEKDFETLNSQDANGKSALHYAVEGGYEDTTMLLLQIGAQANIQDNNGLSPLMTLMSSKRIDNYMSLMDMLIQAGADIHITDFRESRTPLHFAVISKKVDAVEKLLKLGADPNHLDSSGKIPLINLLCYHFPANKRLNGIPDDVMTIVELLSKAGTDMNLTNFKAECSNPLIMATQIRCYQLVRLFLEHGADVNLRFPYTGITPLFIAVKRNDMDSVRVLLDWSCRTDIVGRCRIRMADYDDVEDFEVNPFSLAIHLGSWEIVRMLVLNGYNVSKIPYLCNSNPSYLPTALKHNPEMLSYLRSCASSPYTLLRICILVIFKSLRSNISNKVDLLPLPTGLKEFMKFGYYRV